MECLILTLMSLPFFVLLGAAWAITMILRWMLVRGISLSLEFTSETENKLTFILIPEMWLMDKFNL